MFKTSVIVLSQGIAFYTSITFLICLIYTKYMALRVREKCGWLYTVDCLIRGT